MSDGSGGFSRFDLYELTVQNAGALVPLLMAIHGGTPRARLLAEDFCGTAALAREWVRTVKRGRATGMDIDAGPLAHARGSLRGAVRLVRGDVLATRAPRGPKADIIFVGNFSIGEIHTRRVLVRYLRRCRERLAKGGVFICDIYGGASAFKTGAVQRMHPVPGDAATRIRYTWHQREANPITGMVENALHFRVERAGEIVQEMTDAFVYHWRLWSLSELREAMLEAGFARVEVYNKMLDATDSEGNAYVLPVEDPADLGENWIVCVAGRG
ncbi:MAG: class I SAM-dependent methyltransferase [Phycisphaerales bacterium]